MSKKPKTKILFGEEPTTSKRKYARKAATAKTVVAKRTYRKRKTTTTSKNEGLVSIQVPANIAFQLGVHLGQTFAAN